MPNIRWTSKSGNWIKESIYPAVCSKCEKSCEVPFKPNEDRDIFCRDCYSE